MTTAATTRPSDDALIFSAWVLTRGYMRELLVNTRGNILEDDSFLVIRVQDFGGIAG